MTQMNVCSRFSFLLGAILLIASAFSADEQRYLTTWIGDGQGGALTDEGTVGFQRWIWYDTYAPVVWEDGEISVLEDGEWTDAWIFDMNDNGVAVGIVNDSNNHSHAAININGNWEIISGLAQLDSVANSINDNGQVAGWYVWNGTPMLFIFTLGYTGPTALCEGGGGLINSGGTIAYLDENHSPCLWYDYSSHAMTGFPAGTNVVNLVAINSSNQVLCWLEMTGWTFKAVIWDNNTVLELPTLNGAVCWAIDLNDECQAIGKAHGVYPEEFALWEFESDLSDASVKQIIAPGVAELHWVYEINNEGQILAAGNYHETLFLLTPDDEEPASDATPPTIGALTVTYAWETPDFPMFTVPISDASGIDPDTVRIWIDGNFVPCAMSNGVLYCVFDHPLPWGAHTIEVNATDGVGNQAAALFTALTIGGTDTTAPVIFNFTIEGVSQTDTPFISAFILDSESWVDWNSVVCYLDNEYVPHVADTNYGPLGMVTLLPAGALSPGPHSVLLSATDHAHNTSELTGWSFSIDSHVTVSNVEPTGTIGEWQPLITANIDLGGFTWEDVHIYLDSEPVAYEHDNEGDIWFQTDSLEDGEHTLIIAGEAYSFVVDTTGPEFFDLLPSLSAIIEGDSVEFSGRFNDALSAIDTDSLEINLDGTWESIDAGAGIFEDFTHNYTGEYGEREAVVRIRDVLGNSGYGYFSFYLDPEGLSLSVIEPPPGARLTAIPTVYADTVGDNVNYQSSIAQIDGGPAIDFADLIAGYYDPNMEAGVHTVYVHIYNDDETVEFEYEWSFILDWTAPTITEVSPPNASTVYNMVVPIYVTFADDATEATVWLEVDGVALPPFGVSEFREPVEDLSNQIYMEERHFSESGTHEVYALITDSCGNYVETSWFFDVDLETDPDTDGPIIEIEPNDETMVYEPKPMIRICFFDERSELDYSTLVVTIDGNPIDGKLSQGQFLAWPDAPLEHGAEYIIEASIADMYENYSFQSTTFEVDLQTITVEIHPVRAPLPTNLTATVRQGGANITQSCSLSWQGSICDQFGHIAANASQGTYTVVATATITGQNGTGSADLTLADNSATTAGLPNDAIVIGDVPAPNPYALNWYVLFSDLKHGYEYGGNNQIGQIVDKTLGGMQELFTSNPSHAKVIDASAGNQALIDTELDRVDSGALEANGDFIVYRLFIDRGADAPDVSKYLSRKDTAGIIWMGHGWETPHPDDLKLRQQGKLFIYPIESRCRTYDHTTRIWTRDWMKWARHQDLVEAGEKLDFVYLHHCCSYSMGTLDPYKHFTQIEAQAYVRGAGLVPKRELVPRTCQDLFNFTKYVDGCIGYGYAGDLIQKFVDRCVKEMKPRFQFQ